MKKFYLTSAHNLLNSDEPYEFTISTEKPQTNRGHELTTGWLGTHNNTYNYALGEYDSVEEAKAAVETEEVRKHLGGLFRVFWNDEPNEDGDITGNGYQGEGGELYEIVWHNPDNEWPEFTLKEGSFIAWMQDPGNSGWTDEAENEIDRELPDFDSENEVFGFLKSIGFQAEISNGQYGHDGVYVIAKKV